MNTEQLELVKKRRNSEMSSGERTVFDYLTKKGYVFEREYFFNDCINKSTGYHFFFDFYLYNQNTVIEVDGVHHFKATKGKSAFEYQKQKDNLKNKFCKQKGIRIIRIRYNHGGISINNLEKLLNGPFKPKPHFPQKHKKVKVKEKKHFQKRKKQWKEKSMDRLINYQAKQREVIEQKREAGRKNYPSDILRKIHEKVFNSVTV